MSYEIKKLVYAHLCYRKETMRRFLLVVIVCGLIAAFAASLQAEPFGQAFTSVGSGLQLGNGPYTLGWSFYSTSPITVTDLAVFHDNGAGLMESHDMGIWTAAGALVVSRDFHFVALGAQNYTPE
jgi:hypothetical protein